MGDNTLEKFHVEYEKLHKALKKSHENEKRLMQKCRELNAEMVTHGTKVTQLMTLSEEDKTMIASLKQVKKEIKRNAFVEFPLVFSFLSTRRHKLVHHFNQFPFSSIAFIEND